MVLILILLLTFGYLIFVFSFLSSPSSSSNVSDSNAKNPHQLLRLNNNNKNKQDVLLLQGNVQFDKHNFLHDALISDGANKSQADPSSSSSSSPPLIHIVHTRFMQHQGKLTHLAQARLHLFETFCLPTMIHQSNQNFLWFIQVDPQIDLHILNTLMTFVRPYPNIFIITSLVNYWIGPEKNGSWRNGIEGTEIWSHVYRDEVFTGNLDLIVTAMRMEETDHPIILETRLDADDGLHTHFIESIQRDAIHVFTSTKRQNERIPPQKQQELNVSSTPRWTYWCSKQYLVWFYEESKESYHDSLGSVELREMVEDECITPGLTVGMNRFTTYEEVPQYDHNQLYRSIVLNKDNNKKNNNQGCGGKSPRECIRFWKDTKDGISLSAIRARTLTSAGMKDIQPQHPLDMSWIKNPNPQEEEGQQQEEKSSTLWFILQSPSFSISITNIKQTRQYIHENIVDIAKENLQGQCRGKHSCKESSQILLQKIIDTGSTNVTLK